MNKKVIILIIMACLFVSCSVLSKVGKSIGIVKEKEVSEKVESTKKVSTKINTEKRIDVENLVIWMTVLVAIALCAKYYIKNIKNQNE